MKMTSRQRGYSTSYGAMHSQEYDHVMEVAPHIRTEADSGFELNQKVYILQTVNDMLAKDRRSKHTELETFGSVPGIPLDLRFDGERMTELMDESSPFSLFASAFGSSLSGRWE